jgi:hypothetical protein
LNLGHGAVTILAVLNGSRIMYCRAWTTGVSWWGSPRGSHSDRRAVEVVIDQAHDGPRPSPLRTEIEELASRLTVLQAGAILHPAMYEDAETRYGRIVAAQLAVLAIRGYLWFRYGGEYVGTEGMMASRHPDPADGLEAEERKLMDIIFGGVETVRLARARPGGGQQWDELAAKVDERLKAAGLGWTRLERYRVLRTLLRLRKAMRDHAAAHRQWSQDPELHRAGYPFAVLFEIETGPLRWPEPPEEELFLPSYLPQACHLAIKNAT